MVMERKHNVGSGRIDQKGSIVQEMPQCCFLLPSWSFLSICISHLFSSPPISTWLCFEKEWIPHSYNNRRALSYSAVMHAFMHSSLPAQGWICPIMPWGFHSFPFPSNFHTIIPPSQTPSGPASQMIVSVSIPVVSGTDIACCHLHRRTGGQSFSGSGWCYHK